MSEILLKVAQINSELHIYQIHEFYSLKEFPVFTLKTGILRKVSYTITGVIVFFPISEWTIGRKYRVQCDAMNYYI